jgi:hypothetical protein
MIGIGHGRLDELPRNRRLSQGRAAEREMAELLRQMGNAVAGDAASIVNSLFKDTEYVRWLALQPSKPTSISGCKHQ